MQGDPIVLLLALAAISGLFTVAGLAGRLLPRRRGPDDDHFDELAALHAALDADYDREGRP